jgi:acylphosphatase
MKTKIFNQLKQEHSKLGLSDEVLQDYAESLASTGFVTDENLATVVKGQEKALKAFQSSLDKERQEKASLKKSVEDLKKEKNPEKKDEPDIQAMIKAGVEAEVKPLREKLTNYETNEAKALREKLIRDKATELEIPDWRMKEGFAIPDSMDEAGITTYLTSIKQNIVTAGLGRESGAFPPSTPEEKAKEEAKAFASQLPDA